jgi:hypothetical protein
VPHQIPPSRRFHAPGVVRPSSTQPRRVQADDAVLAELSKGLSGGDILNVCVNAIHPGSVDADPAKWKVKQEMLEREIKKVRKAKAEHSGKKGRNRRMIGFQPS